MAGPSPRRAPATGGSRSRRALVTGGSRGIGRAIAAALTAAGHHVVIAGRSQASLDAALAEGVAAEGRSLDATDLDALAGVAAEDFDILINNAGGAETAPLARTDRALLRRMMLLNLDTAAEAMRAALPGMAARGFGRIVSVASTAGLKGYAYASAYAAAKHALVGLTRSAAIETARTGVTVNALCPGYTDTDLVAEAAQGIAIRTGRSVEEARAHFTSTNPMGRLVRPDEVAAAALWLVGEGAGSVTGQAIAIAGGEL